MWVLIHRSNAPSVARFKEKISRTRHENKTNNVTHTQSEQKQRTAQRRDENVSHAAGCAQIKFNSARLFAT